jgi:hypothetical protein
MGIDKFKNKFKEITIDINQDEVKKYFNDNVYNGVTDQKKQMDLLIKIAINLNLNNFSILESHLVKEVIESIETILYLFHKNETIDTSLYSDRQFACDAGTLTNLQDIISDITMQGSLESIVIRYKKEMLEGLAMEMLGAGGRDVAQINGEKILNFEYRGTGMQVHDVPTILNVLAKDWGILEKTQEEDTFVKIISDKYEIKRIKDYVQKKVETIFEKQQNDIVEAILSKLVLQTH